MFEKNFMKKKINFTDEWARTHASNNRFQIGGGLTIAFFG
jgi:hypothetical protein